VHPREYKQGEGQRNRLSTEQGASWLDPGTPDHDLSLTQKLNRLSHPGAPGNHIFKMISGLLKNLSFAIY